MDLALATSIDLENPNVGDLALEAGQLYLLDDETAAVAQHLLIRLRFFLGEWFLDTREGIPFFDDIFTKNPSHALVSTIFKQTILKTPGVEQLDSFVLEFDLRARSASLEFKARLLSGVVLEFEDFLTPFVLEEAA